jgi:hypothetical protein
MSPLASLLAGQMPRVQTEKASPARPPGSTILPLRIELVGSDPLIWRRVLVPDTVTLGTVHAVIQSVFIWDNSHMHGFRTVGQGRRWLGGEDDCGGVWGYSERVAALRDPKHPDHAEVRGWFGKKWDATAFDIDAANQRLKARVSRVTRVAPES